MQRHRRTFSPDERRQQARWRLRPGPTDWGRRRVEAGLSLRDLEAATGINRFYLSMLEKGRWLPTPDEVERIMAATAPTESTTE